MEAAMTELSSETRRLLQLSRDGDDPTAAREQAVRDRLITRLGVTALAGAATASAAVGAAEAASLTSAGALSTGAPASSVVGSAAVNAVSMGATTATLVKTVAGLVLVAGLGTGAWTKEEVIVEQAIEWSTTVARGAQEAAQRVWYFVTGGAEGARTMAATPPAPSVGYDARQHELLIAIARRPDHPVAKEAELILILSAEQALVEGDDVRATRYLDEHEARFAGGPLSDDRQVLRARIDRGRGAAGEAAKTNF